MFFVLEGELEVAERDGSVTLSGGEFCIVPRGTEHRVAPKGHVKLMLFEPSGTSHTGSVKSEITKERFERLEL
jgi:mannose-6-phosphate isomerase-like protein (cupin superfamily)